jgi:hypothetical protein
MLLIKSEALFKQYNKCNKSILLELEYKYLFILGFFHLRTTPSHALVSKSILGEINFVSCSVKKELILFSQNSSVKVLLLPAGFFLKTFSVAPTEELTDRSDSIIGSIIGADSFLFISIFIII